MMEAFANGTNDGRPRLRKMTKLSDLERRLPARDLSDGDHFHKCPVWGQAVDWRDLRQVVWHEQPRHRRMDLDS